MPREVPDWHDQALCREYPTLVDAWHDARPRSAEAAAARLICSACPVRLLCAVGALERREPYGIWGGLDRQDRKAIAARFGYEPPGDPPAHGTNSRRVKWGCPCPECKGAHALYEAMRREHVRARARARELWATPVVLAGAVRAGRGRAWPGQLLLPLPVVVAGGVGVLVAA
ncbi:hypothetical protein GCM10027436_88490 [Actinophytocola sediminis]